VGNGPLESAIGCCNCPDCQQYIKGLEQRIVTLEKLVDSLTSSVDSLGALDTDKETRITGIEARIGNHANWLSELASEFHNYVDRNPGRNLR
jgi:hypothetical protein